MAKLDSVIHIKTDHDGLRDRLAMTALQGIIIYEGPGHTREDQKRDARRAYGCADAMLKVRDEG